MKFGKFQIDSFIEQHFRLDGGSMFGVVPKSIWQRLLPADENNLIPMVTNIFLLRANGKNILFDIGLGDTLSEKEKKIFGTDGSSSLESGLAEFGVTPEKIDFVILTHLHTDHAGGAVKLTNGEYVPRFENARYIVSRDEWRIATNPDERTRAVYIPERLRPLEEAGQVEFIERDTELFPGVRAIHTGGHTADHFALEIESEGKGLFYYADILSTVAHLPVAYIPAVDLYPAESMKIKRTMLNKLVDRDIILALDHDISTPLVKLKENKGRPAAVPVGKD